MHYYIIIGLGKILYLILIPAINNSSDELLYDATSVIIKA